jgi:5-enolpyruvylshikimate-3-phosphate synthase
MNGEAHIMRLEAQIERLKTEVTEIKSKMTVMPLTVETSVIKWLGAMIICAMVAFAVTTCAVEGIKRNRSKEQKIEAPIPSPQEKLQPG